MADNMQRNLPQLFAKLMELQCLHQAEIAATPDGFWAAAVSVAEVLARRGITTVLNSQGEVLECGLFFDDWYLYAVSGSADCTCGLFKMREQEHDAAQGRKADGDMPGVTISFIALQPEILLACLQDPTPQNRAQLNGEINRVVAYRGQRHSEKLKQYFIRTEAQGAYLIANLYTGLIASLAKDGSLPVPERYVSDHRKQKNSGRVPQFLEENNRNAGRVICDHQTITICDPLRPTAWERLAILATHTGNTSFFSFAAEVHTIFFRLLDEDTRNQFMTRDNSFSDVQPGMWFNTAVSTMASMGVINGYPNGTFQPNANITRAEFAAIAARFDANGNTTGVSFSDIYEHWAYKEISIAANNGWILGYEDGTFKPNQHITRAEAMALVNRVLQRIPEHRGDLLHDMVKWADNMDFDAWYYLTVQEATNSHDYRRKNSGYEFWTVLREVPDWTALER